MSNYVVNKSIRIKSSPDKVWNALTDPEMTEKYFFHCKVFSDWQPGSTITFKGKIFYIFPIEMTGEITQIEQGRLLQYTLKNGKDDSTEGFSTVTDRLTYENGITTVYIKDDVGDAEGAEQRYNKSQKGWDKVLHGLKKTVEEAN